MTPPSQPPRHPWVDVRWLTAGIVTLFGGIVLWGLFGPEPRIVVSQKTTIISEPLNADGLPDYRTHALARDRPAPNDNAAVPLFLAFWKTQVDVADRPSMLVALGLPAAFPADPGLVDPRSEGNSIIALVGRARRPWQSDEEPALSEWLRTSEHGIDRLLQAASRPRYWFPGPSLLQRPPDLLFRAGPRDMQLGISATYILACRAMWHLGESRTQEAWRDILAIHRLSRCFAPPERGRRFYADVKAAFFAAGMANNATRQLLESPQLRRSDRCSIRDELEALGPFRAATGTFGMERLAGIELAVAMGDGRLPGGWWGRAEILQGTNASRRPPWLFVVGTSLDWNIVLRELNAAYDALDAAASLPTPAECMVELARLEAARAITAAPAGPWQDAGTLFTFLVNRPERSVRAARAIEALLLPALSIYAGGLAHSQADFDALVREAAADTPTGAIPPTE